MDAYGIVIIIFDNRHQLPLSKLVPVTYSDLFPTRLPALLCEHPAFWAVLGAGALKEHACELVSELNRCR